MYHLHHLPAYYNLDVICLNLLVIVYHLHKLLKQWLPENILLNSAGDDAEKIWIEEFNEIYLKFFNSVMGIQKADISLLSGFGELGDDNQPQYDSFHEFITDTFADDREDYWKNWRELFDTSMMTREFFEMYYKKCFFIVSIVKISVILQYSTDHSISKRTILLSRN